MLGRFQVEKRQPSRCDADGRTAFIFTFAIATVLGNPFMQVA